MGRRHGRIRHGVTIQSHGLREQRRLTVRSTCVHIASTMGHRWLTAVAEQLLKPAFEEFRRASFGSNFDDEHPLHVVIEARHAGERAIIDLTIGQLRSGGAPVPFQLDARVAPDGGWVELTGDGLIITYMDSPNLDHLPPAAKPDQFAGFVADLHDGMSLALQCQLNSRRFHAELRSQFPQDMLTWERRIAGWMTIP